MRFTGFIGPSYTAQSVNVDCQRCVNLYPELDQLGTGKEQEVASLVGTPGLTLLVTLPNGPVRGMWRASDNTLYAVGGNTFYTLDANWTATAKGTLNTSTGPVSMADNGLQVVVVDGANGYYWDLNAKTFTQIVDASFFGANQVTYQDGYFIFNKPNTQTFYLSPINAITPFNSLDAGTAEALPDNLVGLMSINEMLFLWGTQTTEVFYDSGANSFPFDRIQGAAVNVGCSAAFSIAKVQGVPYWVGGDDTGSGIVYRMQGYQPVRISTPAIETLLRSVGTTNLSNARAWTYQQSGHLFYVLNVPGLNSTWVYDASTSLWHERTWLNLWSQERHRGDCHIVGNGVNAVGDYVNGNIYQLDPAMYTDNGTNIVRTRTAPHISKSLNRVFHNSFQLDMEVGVGTAAEDPADGGKPLAILQWSDDGGHNWSNEHYASIGEIGQTLTRVIWRRLGASRDRVYRVIISDPVKVTLIGAELDVMEGAA